MRKLNLDPGDVMNRVEEIYGPDWKEEEIPTYYRNKQKEIKKSVCCDARLIGGVQCENCGADGRKFERAEIEARLDELREDEHWAEITKRSDEQDLINAQSF